jgi:hypothetical protein
MRYSRTPHQIKEQRDRVAKTRQVRLRTKHATRLTQRGLLCDYHAQGEGISFNILEGFVCHDCAKEWEADLYENGCECIRESIREGR